MRIVFWGSAEFSVPILEQIYFSTHKIVCVVTSKEKPSGRGLKIKPNAVYEKATQLGIKTIAPANPNTEEVYKFLATLEPEVCVLASYGYIIKEPILSLPPKGFINVHPSLLPKYRGPAPIQRVLINGEKVTGVTTFFMNAGIDSGNIILQKAVEIGLDETYDELRDRLAKLGAELALETLELIDKNFPIITRAQNECEKSYAPKIKKEECQISWERSKFEIHNLIRGLSREPGAFTYFRGRRVKILKTRVPEDLLSFPAKNTNQYGGIIPHNKRLFVSTQDSYLEILSLQVEGGKVISALDFINGQRLTPEDYFEYRA
ncbi:MAG: methionyl-tRNA formyltransferase [candidate division WOR-3 bacterium]|nr:methionyl-tRNA formyltransferase [candidate division WOR-3 bacterium]MCX7757878.1 methionyl-tRNA formyltransferase [candidate division WOR-3 bacterium]MDW7987674.1 methionyl-tRNA formyltransferase [candidate division WOR-3 bacterium]